MSLNGEVFEGPNYCGTLRQVEHAAAAAAEVVALNMLSRQGPFSVSCCTDPCELLSFRVLSVCVSHFRCSCCVKLFFGVCEQQGF